MQVNTNISEINKNRKRTYVALLSIKLCSPCKVGMGTCIALQTSVCGS